MSETGVELTEPGRPSTGDLEFISEGNLAYGSGDHMVTFDVLEVIIDGVAQIARPGVVAIVPSNARHSVKALTDGRAIIVDHPARPEFGWEQTQA